MRCATNARAATYNVLGQARPPRSAIAEAVSAGAEPQAHGFTAALNEFIACWLVVWVLWATFVDQTFSVTLNWLAYSALSALAVPMLLFYVPIFVFAYVGARLLAHAGWWAAHRIAILASLCMTCATIYVDAIGQA